jgi:hypothetical protein
MPGKRITDLKVSKYKEPRGKFFQRYRLFFRYPAPSKVIVFAWVND